MKILMHNLQEYINRRELNYQEAFYLACLADDVESFIDQNSLLRLINDGFIIKRRVNKDMFSMKEEKDDIIGSILPKYINTKSQDVVKHICKLLCTGDKNGKIIFANESDAINNTAKLYLQNEQILARYYLIFLLMFPVRGKTNLKWERQFLKKKYDGKKLRVRSKGSAKTFKRLATTHDMGALLLGTYNFIMDSIIDGKPFVMTPTNYLKQYDDWYHGALQQLSGKETVGEMLKAKSNKKNVTIIV